MSNAVLKVLYVGIGHLLNSYAKLIGGSVSLDSWGVHLKKQGNAQPLP